MNEVKEEELKYTMKGNVKKTKQSNQTNPKKAKQKEK